MNPEQNQNPDPLQNTYNPLKVMQEGERVICEIKRHPFGLLGIYFSVTFIVIAALAAAILIPHYTTTATSQMKEGLFFGALLVIIITLLYGYVARIVYKGNRWIVTSDSLTQISQMSLFKSQTSQLSLANLEDVTVSQDGLLQSMIGFGTLKVETAGEHSKFTFPFCPKPNQYAKQIIAAHEAYIAENPEEMHTTNRAVANTSGFNQTYAPPAAQTQPAGPQYAQPQPSQPPQAQYEQPAQAPQYPPEDPTNTTV